MNEILCKVNESCQEVQLARSYVAVRFGAEGWGICSLQLCILILRFCMTLCSVFLGLQLRFFVRIKSYA